MLDALIDRFLVRSRPARAILLDEQGRYGALWLYRARLTDGLGNPAMERLLALFYDFTSGETRPVDPRMLWELDEFPHGAPLPNQLPSLLQQADAPTRHAALQHLAALEAEATARREREYTIKKRWLEESYKQLIQESQDKLLEYHKRRDAGDDMDAAIRQEEQNLKELVQERQQRLAVLEQERCIQRLEPTLEAVALIVPKSLVEARLAPPDAAPEASLTPDEAAKRQVEAAGMHAALEYERRQGRQPEDVSHQFLVRHPLARRERNALHRGQSLRRHGRINAHAPRVADGATPARRLLALHRRKRAHCTDPAYHPEPRRPPASATHHGRHQGRHRRLEGGDSGMSADLLRQIIQQGENLDIEFKGESQRQLSDDEIVRAGCVYGESCQRTKRLAADWRGR